MYDAPVASIEAMQEAIVELGYQPKIVRSRIDLGSSTRESSGAMPEPVAAAIGQARESGKLVFLEFYAQWCGACKTMDKTTFSDPAVKTALEQFVFVKVDADQFPAAARHFNVFGMPTMVALDASGEEIYRQVGPLDAESLTGHLSLLLSGESIPDPVGGSEQPRAAEHALTATTAPTKTGRNTYVTYVAQVSGLACPFCVHGLESSIGKIAAVEAVAVDLKTGVVHIRVPDSITLSEAQVRETIEDAGFTLESFAATTLRN